MRNRVLSLAEQRKWLEACQASRNPSLYPLAALLCATGARIGELQQLRWRDVHLDPGEEHVVIRRGSVARETTKNRMIRAVPIGWQASAVEALRAHQARAHGTETVFVGSLRRAFEKSIAAAGLQGVTPHTLRHTVATELAEAGFTTHQLMAFFGWKTSRMADRYIHAQPQRMLASLPMARAHKFVL